MPLAKMLQSQYRGLFGRGQRPPPVSPLSSNLAQPFTSHAPHHAPLALARRARARGVLLVLVGAAALFLALDVLHLGPRFLHSSRTAKTRAKPRPAPTVATTSAALSREAASEAAHVESAQSCPASNPSCQFRGAPWQPRVYQWLSSCWAQNLERDPFLIHEALPSQSCPGDCSGHGVCNPELGECHCQLGWTGPECADDSPLLCNRDPSPEFPRGTWLPTICPAHCNPRNSRCQCGPGTKHPQRHLSYPCGFAFDHAQNSVDVSRVDNATLTGFCSHDPSAPVLPLMTGEWHGCPGGCPDGLEGSLCQVPVQAYCLGQCSGHGACLSGHCQCRDGFWGVDCSAPSLASPPALLGDSAFLVTAPPASAPAAPEEPSDADAGGTAGAAAGAGAGAAGAGPRVPEVREGAMVVLRKRPLIYVYDLPRRFNTHHLESRVFRTLCTPRLYSRDNSSFYNPAFLYGMEVAVLEGVLASPHRTLQAEEADFFLVPLLGGCIHVRADENPSMLMPGRVEGSRMHFAAEFYKWAQEHISQRYPHWNRTGGRDHIWIFPWDEGACAAPREVWPSILLSHWGNTMARHNYSTTAYLGDSWRRVPGGFTGGHPCFDPSKDVVMPALKMPSHQHLTQRLWERPIEERQTLFYFNGNLGRNYGGRIQPHYSLGIRQRVAAFYAHALDLTGHGPENFHKDVRVTSDRAPNYADDLASSKFCGVFPGDGFSARMEDAILHGCIPVVIQDGIQMAFENVLDLAHFGVRIAESDIPEMVRILLEIPPERQQQLQRNVSSLALRWFYRGFFLQEAERQRRGGRGEEAWVGSLRSWQGDDAIDTLTQVLAYKLENDPWRRERRDRAKETGQCWALERDRGRS